MKKFLFALILLFTFLGNIFSQWVLQTSTFHMPVSKVYFINDQTGWASVAGGYMFSSSGSFGRTTNGGNNWQVTVQAACTAYNDFCFINDMTGWLIGTCATDIPPSISYIRKTTNSGLNFIDQKIDSASDLNSVFFLDLNTGWVSGYHGKIYKTTNSGMNWIKIRDSSAACNSMIFRNPNTGFAASGQQILKTTNSGNNWISIFSVSGSNGLQNIFFLNDSIAYACGYNGTIVKTTNGGANWFANTSPTTTMLNSIFFTNLNTGYIAGGFTYTPFTNVILKTTNSGNNWIINETNNNGGLQSIFFLNDNTGWSGGGFNIDNNIHYGQIYKTTNGGITFVNLINSEVPKSFSQSQNYPNPFNPSTKIKFDIPKSSNAKIIIYDVLGREVTTLVNEQLKPGSYETEWDGSDFASGIYFYSLVTNNFTETKKMVLIK